MLSRRHLRSKVLQSLYSFIQSGNKDIASGEKQLLKSIDKLYEMYIYQLSLLIEIVDFARNRIEDNKKKYFPTQDDLHPNTRFSENMFVLQLQDNKEYRKYHDHFKINWGDDQDMIRKLYNLIKADKSYINYMQDDETSYQKDKTLLVKIMKKVISPNEALESYYDDKSVFWAFDVFYLANTMVIKTIKMFQDGWGADHELPDIFKVAADGEMEDRKFMLELFRKSVLRYQDNKAIIAEKAKNWELDRIAVMDILLINMALVELLEFPSIPVKVSMNEYIEISKFFSSNKSKIFINGILDKLVAELKKDKKINKMGRGLIEN